MNKLYLYKVYANFAIVFGFIFFILPFFLNLWESPVATTSLLMGLFLIILGLKIHYHTLKQKKLIDAIFQNKVTALAHWQYTNQNIPFLRNYLSENCTHMLTDIFLFFTLGSLISIGFYLTGSNTGIHCSFLLFLALTLGCSLLSIIIKTYYARLTKTPLEAIIYKDCIYFLDTLYQFSPKGYPIRHVFFKVTPCYCIDIECEFYGTRLALAPVITIPVPATNYADVMSLLEPLGYHF